MYAILEKKGVRGDIRMSERICGLIKVGIDIPWNWWNALAL
jgi:hypothetical protein